MVESPSTQPEEEMHDLGRPVLGRRVINHVRLLERLGYIISEPVLGVAARADVCDHIAFDIKSRALSRSVSMLRA